MFPSPEGHNQPLHILLWWPKYLKMVLPFLLDGVVNMHHFCCTWDMFLNWWFELTTATPAAWTRLQLFPFPHISALMGEVGNYCQLIKGLGSWRRSKITPQALLCSGELCVCVCVYTSDQSHSLKKQRISLKITRPPSLRHNQRKSFTESRLCLWGLISLMFGFSSLVGLGFFVSFLNNFQHFQRSQPRKGLAGRTSPCCGFICPCFFKLVNHIALLYWVSF